MEWLYYLLEANLYLLLFYGFYRVFLSETTFYSNNRYFLLLSSITAFILPVTQLGILNPTPIVDNILFPPPIPYNEYNLSEIALAPIQENIIYTNYLYPLYLLVAFFFAIKLSLSIIKIIQLWLKANKRTNGNITLIELDEEKSAFSFFNLLFIHSHLAETKAVLRHEMVHIKHKHSVDILFFEVIQIICWFNPIIYFLKKEIKLVHEYIADELSTNTEMQKHDYAMFLIENSFGIVPQKLTNQIFNQSILKRRINMLNKKRTAGWARLRLLLALPLAGAMLCTSTMAFTKDYGYIDLLPQKSKTKVPDQEVPKKNQVKFPPPIGKLAKNFSPSYQTGKNKQYISLEKRVIFVNGVEITNKNNFYGVTNADTIRNLNPVEAIAKYGSVKGKLGAVEITGKKTKFITIKPDNIKFPPPIVKPSRKNLKSPPPVEPPPARLIRKTPPKQDVVKFPPPIVKQDPPFFKPKAQNHYYEEFRLDLKTGKPKRANNMYIIVNGTPYENQDKFYGAENTESVTILNGKEAIKKYGEKGKYRAVEITGVDIKFMNELPTPPPVEPPPPSYKPKRDRIKFPPPIIKKNTIKVN